MNIRNITFCSVVFLLIQCLPLRAQDTPLPYEMPDATAKTDTSLFTVYGAAVSPFGIFAGQYSKLRFRFQASTEKYFAVGLDLRIFIGKAYPGYQLSPFIKLYPGKKATRGFYVYGAYFIGQNKGIPDETQTYYLNAGPGFGAGFQKGIDVAGTLYVDFGIGCRFIQTEGNITPDHVDESYEDFFVIGPGSFPEFTSLIGYRF